MTESGGAPTVDDVAEQGCGGRPSGAVSALRGVGADLVACVAIAAVLTVILVTASNQRPNLELWLWAFAVNLIISTAIGLTLSNLYRFAQGPFLRRFPGRLGLWASHVLIVTLGTAFGVEVAVRIIHALGAVGGPRVGMARGDVLRVALVIAVVVTAAAVSFETLRQRARRIELQAQQAKQEALHAQLEALQARTNPHFLFNSLNTVAGLINDDPTGAEQVLEKLSSLFRYSLEGSKIDWVRLEREIEAVESYLEVERVRLGDRLRAEVEVEAGLEELLVPPLVLQPLVENAVQHAVAPRAAGGHISVAVRRDGTALCLEVTDDGPGLGGSRHRGSGTALEDLRQRIGLVYGPDARLGTESPAGGGCRVTLRLPLAGAGSPAARSREAG